MTGNSFSPVASAVLHEEGWLSDFLDHQLAHAERNIVKAADNHAWHLPEHTKMLRWREFGTEREDK
jgi:hypothetical protein